MSFSRCSAQRPSNASHQNINIAWVILLVFISASSCYPGMVVGRTPLIKLSPKKTWEGFIGGAAATLIASWYLAAFMSRYQWMTCERNVRTVLFKPPI